MGLFIFPALYFLLKEKVFCLLGTPDTNFNGRKTRNVLKVERSTPDSPSSEAGIKYGKNLKNIREISDQKSWQLIIHPPFYCDTVDKMIQRQVS